MEDRKTQILEAALKRFGHFGYTKTTMNEIAEDLGITKPNLYYYYEDKLSLFLDIVNHIAAQIEALERQVIARYQGGFLQTCYDLLELKATWLKKYNTFQMQDGLDIIKQEKVQLLLDELNSKHIQLYEQLIKKGVDTGELNINDTYLAAKYYVEIMKGISLVHNVKNTYQKMFNDCYSDQILEAQREATKFIFEGKINA